MISESEKINLYKISENLALEKNSVTLNISFRSSGKRPW